MINSRAAPVLAKDRGECAGPRPHLRDVIFCENTYKLNLQPATQFLTNYERSQRLVLTAAPEPRVDSQVSVQAGQFH